MKKLVKKLFEKTNFYFDFTKSIIKTLSMLKKNKVYKLIDLYHAMKKAWAIIHKKIQYQPFAKGNNKLEKNILIFDLPEIITCKHACHGCYAQKASRLYKNTRVKRLYNLILILFAIYNAEYQNKLLKQWKTITDEHVKTCKKNKLIPILRLHAAGDIFSNEYLQFIKSFIDRKNKLLHVYSYTKKLSNTQIDNINNRKQNFNIVKSIFEVLEKKYINFGNIEYIIKIALILKKNKIDFSICSYKLSDSDIELLKQNKLIKHVTFATCGTCMACMKKSIVLFKKH